MNLHLDDKQVLTSAIKSDVVILKIISVLTPHLGQVIG